MERKTRSTTGSLPLKRTRPQEEFSDDDGSVYNQDSNSNMSPDSGCESNGLSVDESTGSNLAPPVSSKARRKRKRTKAKKQKTNLSIGAPSILSTGDLAAVPSSNSQGLSSGSGSVLCRPAATAGSSSLPPSSTNIPTLPTEPTSMPGVYTDRALRSVGLGMLVDIGVFFCLDCLTPDGKRSGICAKQIVTHRHKHHGGSESDKNLLAVKELLPRYPGAWNGDGQCPIPDKEVAPFPFLDIISATGEMKKGYTAPMACGLCPPDNRYIWVTTSTRTSHLKKHNTSVRGGATGHIPLKAVQNFHPNASYQRYFPVDPSLAPLPSNATDEEQSLHSAFASYLAKISHRDVPAEEPMGPSIGLKDDNPFLNSQGWSHHFEGENPKDLMSLVTVPASGHQWRPIIAACHSLAVTYQQTITQSPTSIRETWIKTQDAAETQWSKLLPTVEDCTLEDYSRNFSQLIHLVLEAYRRSTLPSGGDELYRPYLTTDQSNSAKKVISFLDSNESLSQTKLQKLQSLIHNLAVTCFAPQNIDHIAQNKYNDIAYTFMALKSVRADSTYCSPNSLARPNSALQYVFRACLLHQAHQQVNKFRNAAECYDYYYGYVVNAGRSTPFSQLKCMRRLLIKHINLQAGIKRLHWYGLDKAICVYSGKHIKLEGIKDMAQDILDATEKLFFKLVLLDIPLSEIGYKDPDLEKLRDDMGENGGRYSVWRDKVNSELLDIQDKLTEAFITHPKLKDHFWSETLPDGSPAWNDDRRRQWLKHLGEFSQHLALSCHIWGGLPRRAPELLNARNHNAEGRPRNAFLYALEMVLMLGYCKTTALTGVDRTDVHALPPRLTRLIIILNSLVRPLAVQWVKELYDPEDNDSSEADLPLEDGDDVSPPADTVDHPLDEEKEDEGEDDDPNQDFVLAEDMAPTPDDQPTPVERAKNPNAPFVRPSKITDGFLFSYLGRKFKPEDITKLLALFSKKHLGVAIKFRAWRNICIAIQRDHLGLVDDESAGAQNTIFTNMAGHSGPTAKGFYALRDDDRNLVSGDIFEKYIQASKCLHRWFNREPLPKTPKQEIMDALTNMENKVMGTQGEVQQMNSRLDVLQEDVSEVKEMRGRVENIEKRLDGIQDTMGQILHLLQGGAMP
ncbi:hypothetical protein FS749_009615 [Ceratobasidium sp. UAMH 11750]|nr:hypothetical protein FS749_009615 [Ceratobasidium sp. UAMH 11750]